ncbi:DUF6773 family protein [Candidatus Contubernalis alkaliaceticus]|uniref:DUF6773 family protein n=1 Tax=Candidatus Contubernalis alkaliaceticus TaxID=338645 RepID=UPI001F4C3361|nr:DUF6773 family protein [Candidatus Contubernalis alkalaceticus]UNC92295.1 hypothetical protein HUE98_09415 [Candidatus Contubernalis alkalaceticus]
MNKKGLDEMQMQRKNKIGNQAFLMLLYLLMLDAGLHGYGFRWVNYPANVMIILTICSGTFVVRLILANAFVGPSAEEEKPFLKVLLTMMLAIVVSAAILVLLKNASFSNPNQIDEMAAPILFITAGVAIVIAVTTIVIKRIQNKNDSE